MRISDWSSDGALPIYPPGPALRHPRRTGRLARRGFAPTFQGCHRMTLPNGFAERDPALTLRPLYLVNRDGLEAWRERQPKALVQWMRAHGFDAASGSQLTLSGDRGTLAGAVLGVGDALDPFSYARSEEHTSELQSLMRISY